MEFVFDYNQGPSTCSSLEAKNSRCLVEWIAVYQQFIGHELANQLVFLQGTARLLLSSAEEMEPEMASLLARLADRVQQTDRQARRLAELGRLLREPAWTPAHPLDELLAECLARLRVGHPEPGWHCSYRPVTLLVRQSRVLLNAVLVELLHNAWNSLVPGRPGTIEVEAGPGDTAGEWWVTVTDNGRGLSEGAEKLLCEPFVAGRQPGATGMGLGLFFIRQAMARWRGRLTLASDKEIGTRVTCRFTAEDVS